MPVHRFITIDAHSAYLVWHIIESPALLAQVAVLSPAEQTDYATITHPQRKKEWLAARVALRTLLTQSRDAYAPIQKDCWGKPYLTDSSLEISLAHCRTFACAASDRQQCIGIDIQQPHERLRRVKRKFLNKNEIREGENSLEKLCIYWCAKEAIYKAVGGKGLSLSDDISIEPFVKSSQGILKATVRSRILNVHYSLFAGHVLAWCRDTCSDC